LGREGQPSGREPPVLAQQSMEGRREAADTVVRGGETRGSHNSRESVGGRKWNGLEADTSRQLLKGEREGQKRGGGIELKKKMN